MKIKIQNCTWQEFDKRREEANNTIIIPVGSTEQHGFHLPLGTDTYAAISIAEEVAKKTGILTAPPIYYGWSPHHMVLPGTVTVRPEILIELLYDIIKSLNAHKFDRFILINGHRIVNISWMQIAAERAKRELGIKAFIADPAYLSKRLNREEGIGNIGHADEIETSHMLYKYPDLVQLDKAVDYTHTKDPLLNVDPGYADDVLCYVPSSSGEMESSVKEAGGTSGKPTVSSIEKGKRYFEWVVERLAEVVEEVKKGNM